jgi:hypothetical protein
MEPLQAEGKHKSRFRKRALIFLLLLFAGIALITVSFIQAPLSLQDSNTNSNANPPSVSQSSTNVILGDPFPMPEYNVGGTLIALVACVAAFAIFKYKKS